MLRRGRIVSFLVTPIAAFLWIVGWGLFFVGSRREFAKPKPKMSVQRELVMFVPTPEEKYAT
jgi:hypothetical protein